MSDPIESAATPEQQKLAEERGWIPATRYKGDPEKFIDADAFIEKTETILPFVKKQLSSARAEADELRKANAELKATVDEVRASVEEIEERYTVETQKRVEAARKDLKSAIREAAEAEDLKLVVKLTEELDTLDDAVKEAKTEKKEEKKPADTKGDLSEEQKAALRETNEWIGEHSWYQTDRKRRALFNSYAQDMKMEGDKRVGKAFYDAVLAEVEKDFDDEGRGSSKVEGGKGSGGNSGGTGKKGYGSLPADAKAACAEDAKRFVGPGKKYAKIEDWQKRYAEIYFSLDRLRSG